MNRTITFIAPCRGRKGMRQGLLLNLEKYCTDYKVMFCEQADDLMFRKGQLANLGFVRSTTDVVAFINLDYRFLESIDLFAELEKAKKPIIPFLYATRVIENNGKIIEETPRGISGCPGGCQIFTKDQFIKCGGHTNLILGWGSDDVVLALRTKIVGSPFVHLPYAMGHVVHNKTIEYRGRSQMKLANRTVYLQYPDLQFDSFKETIADEVRHIVVSPNVETYLFTNIRVPDDFVEMQRYKVQLAHEKAILKL